MSEPNQAQLKDEAKEKFVEEMWDNFTSDRKYEILQTGLGMTFIDDEFQDWCNELANKFRD